MFVNSHYHINICGCLIPMSSRQLSESETSFNSVHKHTLTQHTVNSSIPMHDLDASQT